jgi:hypothetical protein
VIIEVTRSDLRLTDDAAGEDLFERDHVGLHLHISTFRADDTWGAGAALVTEFVSG